MRIFVIVAALIVGLAVGVGAGGALSHGASSADGSTEIATVTETVTRALLPANETRCAAYVSGHEAMVTIFGGGSKACEEWISARSSQEIFWTATPQQGAGERTICTLANGHEDIAVQDGGGTAIGTAVCGELVREGWLETNLPSPPA